MNFPSPPPPTMHPIDPSGVPRYPHHHADAKESRYWKGSPECDVMRTLIKSVLINAHDYEWTVQGFGMLRTYLPFGPNKKRFRLNVWNADMAVPGVSIMHDHPWDFRSWIINGRFRNVRYVEDFHNGDPFKFMTIKCGEEGCAMSEPALIRLRAMEVESYEPGDIYGQRASEIHASFYDQGSVTLNDRVGDTEHARVFWADEPQGYWVDAKPRKASATESYLTSRLALDRWQDEI